MKNIFLIIANLVSFSMNAQSIDFSQINSLNALNIISTSNKDLSEFLSKSSVTQLGNNNSALIYDKSKRSDLMIRQTGDFNTTLMTNTNPNLENKQKVNIEGDNNYIDITGNNSNSKEMQINLKTNDKMIFVRHY
ncbi:MULTISPECIES: hypothetical protein [unclassified Kaistella]|uniref:hypothetical protein n=1 Tax=unclassified Kaistella TaxID=2762626 RepID=UPI00273392F6|nr:MULTISPECIES: hypothetical protein [unclassified Kaistella]MDP2453896.1 hypothetical protein [Kaistella sp. SH11-4b]MDP2456953.1 hypothetical protein [Kaistella sp. SH40-3]MDP2459710.1 hypothetical protein [Kaistella sp. SH19-2b]